MSNLVLVGPFWTRAEAAEYLGVPPAELAARADVLRFESKWLEETYPALQFQDHEVRVEIAAVVELLGPALPGVAIADWLTRANPALGSATPLEWFNSGQDVNTALSVATADIDETASRMAVGDPLRSVG